MYDSFQRITDVDHIMNERIDVFGKIVAHAKKTNPCLSGIVLDATSINPVNFRGHGYEMPNLFPAQANLNAHNNGSSNSNSAHGIENCYPILFSFPRIESSSGGETSFEKHMRNLIALISNEMDHRVRYFYDQVGIF
jgi:hypothetical protein